MKLKGRDGLIVVAIILVIAAVVVFATIGEPVAEAPPLGTDNPSQTLEGGLPVGSAEGEVITLAGTGAHGARDGQSAQFNLPGGIFAREDGDIYIADTYNNLIRLLDTQLAATRIAGYLPGLDEHGFPHGFHRDGGAGGALFNRPSDILVMDDGRVIVADRENHAIRMILGDEVFTFAGGGAAGHLDGHLSQAMFNRPSALATDGQGNIYIADSSNHVIRRIDVDGYVSTVAGIPGSEGFADGPAGSAVFNHPMGISIAGDGVIYIADTGNHLIRALENGVVRTFAGMLIYPNELDYEWDAHPIGGFADGYMPLFSLPVGLYFAGDVLIVADSANHRIRAVYPNGYTVTLAGSGVPGHTDGIGLAAQFHFPRAVSVVGNYVFVVDSGNNLVRKINANFR